MIKRIIIFASGTGSNAEAIMSHFSSHPNAKVQAVFSNYRKAEVLNKAKDRSIPSWTFNKPAFQNGQLLEILRLLNPDIIVLAGFLWKVPKEVVSYFSPKKIVNIHPSLLPKYGGKGMYGINVHKAVLEGGDTHTGITIHHVNDEYDRGDVIFQDKILVNKGDSAEQLAYRVRELEHMHYPKVIEHLLL